MTRPILRTFMTPLNTRLGMNGPAGPPDFVPVAGGKLTLAAGDVIWAAGGCVCSGRPDGDYPGFSPAYYSTSGIVVTQANLAGLTKADLSTLTWLTQQDSMDAAYGQDPAFTDPYASHVRAGGWQCQAAGAYWCVLLAAAGSTSAGDGDWINCVWPYLSVLRFTG